MTFKNKLVLLFVAVALVSIVSDDAFAKKVRYIATNQRLNYVKLVEVEPKVAAERNMKHPSVVDGTTLVEAIRSVMLSKRHLIGEEIEQREVFNEPAIGFLAKNIAAGLAQATSNEEIQFSYLVKAPIIILRNDRLTAGSAWMSEDGLHMEFNLLASKITADINKRGYETKAIKKKQGARMTLSYEPCQKPGATADELIIDLACCNQKVAQKAAVPAEVAKPTAGKSQAETEEASTEQNLTVEERLQRLDDLKEKKLISEKEYKKKRKEVLKDL